MDEEGVVVTAVGGKLNPDPPDPPDVSIGGDNKVKHYTLGIDFAEATKTLDSTDFIYDFGYNIYPTIMEADEVNFYNFEFNNIRMWGGLVVSLNTNNNKLYMFVAGTSTYGFVCDPADPTVIRWTADMN